MNTKLHKSHGTEDGSMQPAGPYKNFQGLPLFTQVIHPCKLVCILMCCSPLHHSCLPMLRLHNIRSPDHAHPLPCGAHQTLFGMTHPHCAVDVLDKNNISTRMIECPFNHVTQCRALQWNGLGNQLHFPVKKRTFGER